MSTYLVLGIALLIAMTIYLVVGVIGKQNPFDGAGLLLTLAGWFLAFAGLLSAGRDTLRGLTFSALSKLHDDEGTPEQAEAKELVWKAALPKGSSVNLYSYVRKYVRELSSSDQDKLNRARRRLTHFWYRAARMLDLGVYDAEDIFSSIGPPDVLEILEPLEAIQAESINSNWQPRPWPPMRLLVEWYNREGSRTEARRLRLEVPARPDDYKASRADL